jgi:hypothetical protein
MTDFRELCARMADELDHYRQLLMDDRSETHALAAEARAALAQPELHGPTDEELIAAAEEAGLCYPTCWDLRDGEVPQMQYLRDFARAVLARWCRPAIEAVPQQEAE